MNNLRSPVPPEHLVDKYKTYEILDLINEETKRPLPTGEIALNAKLVKLQYLFQELNKVGEDKKVVGKVCAHDDPVVCDILFGNDRHLNKLTHYPILIQKLLDSGVCKVGFSDTEDGIDKFNNLMAHPMLVRYSINNCETSRALGMLTRKCVLFGVEFVLITKEK